jgi:hypothetical protein
MEAFFASCVDAVFVPIYLLRLMWQVFVEKLLVLYEFAALCSQHRVENV